MSSTIEVETDITADELETMIREADPGTTLKLAAGDFEFDDAIAIDRSDVSLIGAGSDSTRLTFTYTALSRNDDHAIHVDGSENTDLGELAGDAEEGARRLALNDARELAVGDTLRIWQDNDDAFLDAIGDSAWRKVEHAELRTSMAKVTAVDGNEVSLDRGIRFDFQSGMAEVEKLDTVDHVDLKGFSVNFELGEADAGEFSNTKDDLTGYQAVHLEGTVNSDLEDILVNDGPSTAFRFSRAMDLQADGLQAQGAFNKGGGGNGYAYELHESYDGQLTGLEDSGMRHGLVFASWRSSVGNEVQVVSTDRDINFHGGRDHDNSVRVLSSIRDPETDGLSPSLYINEEGERFGAPTDPEANEVVFDYLIGSRREDEVQGSDDGVYLNGGLGHDVLKGGAGNDILQGGPGDDWYDGTDLLDGGRGIDTARYTGDVAAHEIAFDEEEARVTGQGSEDTLVDMEFAVFGDGTTLHLASGNAFTGTALDVPDADAILDGDGSTPALVDDDAELLVTGNVTSQWASGYTAEFFVENVSDDEIIDPEVAFDLDADISTLWNGDLAGGADGYRVQDNNANRLAPGEAWRFAFNASGDEALPDAMTASDTEGQSLDVQVLGLGNTDVEEVAA
ncbi:MAG: cellulose binding domain-containing protein [Halomonas sp.]|nr:cellulose binding domain-containing protein [Halomonas sp.]